ncbi:MAG TPA: hypothetical protein VMS93_05400 [Candidatus Saccharimonadales bacterium]|nr:hypothetical protein [Candidatus Saccharimonadales bacterium]
MRSPSTRGPAARLAHLAYRALSLPVAGGLRVNAEALAQCLAGLAQLADPASASIFLDNLGRLRPQLPEAERRRLARRMQRSRARTMLEMLAAPARGHRWARRQVEILGLPALREALRAGRGAVVIWNHVGVPDVGARGLAAHGIPTTGHADRPLGPLLWRGLVRSREALGLHYWPRSSGTAPMLAALRRGELAGVVWDGHAPDAAGGAGRGLEAAVALSRRSGAPLFRGACLPEGPRFRLVLEGPRPAPRGPAEARGLVEDLARAEMRLVVGNLEQWSLVRALPPEAVEWAAAAAGARVAARPAAAAARSARAPQPEPRRWAEPGTETV